MEGLGLSRKLAMVYRYLRTYGKPPETAQTLTIDKTKALLKAGGFSVKEARLVGGTSKALFVQAATL
jgi:hypothetical protein